MGPPNITFVAATPPNVTVAPVWKFVPVIVTEVPPAEGPDGGLTFVTVGSALTMTIPVIEAR